MVGESGQELPPSQVETEETVISMLMPVAELGRPSLEFGSMAVESSRHSLVEGAALRG
jgi:hypothetical protein